MMGGFAYPRGMAGTMRVQNVINSLKVYDDIAIRVIVLRQSTEENILSGVHEGTPYETIMGDCFRVQMFIKLPLFYYKTVSALKKAFRKDHRNIIYFYGPLLFDSVVPLSYARRLGYKIVFDVIEDYDLSQSVSVSLYQSVRYNFVTRLSKLIKYLASGIIAITSHLEKKYRTLTQGNMPIHYLPISVNVDHFPPQPEKKHSTISLFYAGSFGKKDGLSVLLDAFDTVAGRRGNVHLILTGRGDREAMKVFLDRVDKSPNKDRIEFKGYLDEEDYYSLLNTVDIPCMTRVNIDYAHAGFPFKLGEFLATGKPVVASRVSDVERFLVHKQNAMLVQSGSSEEVAAAVEFLIDNQESASAIGKRGREVARTFFDYNQQGKELLAFLQSL